MHLGMTGTSSGAESRVQKHLNILIFGLGGISIPVDGSPSTTFAVSGASTMWSAAITAPSPRSLL